MDHATIPLASAHGSLGAWLSVNVGEHENRDPCRSSGVVGPYSVLAPLTTYRWALLTTLALLPGTSSNLWSSFIKLGLVARLCESGLSMAITNCMPNTYLAPCANEFGLANIRVTETQSIIKTGRSCVLDAPQAGAGDASGQRAFFFYLLNFDHHGRPTPRGPRIWREGGEDTVWS